MSKIYVDDTTIIAPPYISASSPPEPPFMFKDAGGHVLPPIPGVPQFDSNTRYVIHDAVCNHRDNAARILGPNATEDKKTIFSSGYVVSIGWHLNLQYSQWYAIPKHKKVEKMAHYVFNIIQPHDTWAPLKIWQKLTGLLCYFAPGLKLAKPFVYPFFQCRRTTENRILISAAAHRDLNFWRGIIPIALQYPHLVGSSIDSLRTNRPPTSFIVTDACTSTGGGGTASPREDWIPGLCSFYCIIRWTELELQAIRRTVFLTGQQCPVSDFTDVSRSLATYLFPVPTEVPTLPTLTINILEFATAVLIILILAPTLRGQVVSIGTDNTATLCWLVKHRSSAGPADALLKLLSTVCTMYDIKIVAYHLKGDYNYISDWLSRVLGISQRDPDQLLDSIPSLSDNDFLNIFQRYATTTNTGVPPDRRLACRLILTRVLTNPELLSTQTMISLLVILYNVRHISPSADDEILAVLNGFTNSTTRSDRMNGLPTPIPINLNDAYAKFAHIPTTTPN